jgi:hypothetical protein
MNGHTAAAAVNSTKEENEREINKIKNKKKKTIGRTAVGA